MAEKNKDYKGPEGKTKLKIICSLLNENQNTRELRVKLKRNKNFGKEKGSFNKDVFDTHISDLKEKNIIKTIPQGPGLPHICKLKEDYNGFKAIFNFINEFDDSEKYETEKNIKTLLLTDYAEKTINEDFYVELFNHFSNYLRQTEYQFMKEKHSIQKELMSSDLDSDVLEEYVEEFEDMDRSFLFPQRLIDKYKDVIRYSPSVMDFLLNPDKLGHKIFKKLTYIQAIFSFWMLFNHIEKEGEKPSVEEMLFSSKQSQYQKEENIRSPMEVIIEGKAIQDFLDDKLPKKKEVDKILLNIFVKDSEMADRLEKKLPYYLFLEKE